MPQQVIDAFDNVMAWTPVQADGVTPSAAIALTPETTLVRWGADQRALRLTATAGAAQNHRIRRSLPANTDLTNFDEIRFSIRADRAAMGDGKSSFFVEFRIGSVAAPPGSAGNLWHRRIPVRQPNQYETARLSMADLPAPVRAGARILEFRLLSAEAVTIWLDDLIATRAGVVEDADEALRQALHNRASVDGTPVPVVFPLPDPGNGPAPALPHIAVRNVGIRIVPDKTMASERTDFTEEGVAFRREQQIQVRVETRPEPTFTIFDMIYHRLDRANPVMVSATVRAYLRDGAGNTVFVSGPNAALEQVPMVVRGAEWVGGAVVYPDGSIGRTLRYDSRRVPTVTAILPKGKQSL